MKLNIFNKALLAAALLAAPLQAMAETGAAAGARVNESGTAAADGPWFEYLGSVPGENNEPICYVTVNPAGRLLTELAIEWMHELSLDKLAEADLLPTLGNPAATDEQVLGVPGIGGQDIAVRIRYRYEGDEQPSYTRLSNGTNEIWYWTDFMGIAAASGSSEYRGGAYADRTPQGEPLRIGDQVYGKGLCIPNASNCRNTNPNNLRGFVRFKADCGLQYGSPGYDSGRATFLIANSSQAMNGNDRYLTASVFKFDYTIGASGCNLNETLGLSFWNGREGKTEVVGAARFYKAPAERPNSQTISWNDRTDLLLNRPATVELTAVSSFGLPVHYRVVEGNEYARITDGNRLQIFQLPDVQDRVTVEALQPGSHSCSAAEPLRRTFELTHSLEVYPGQRAVLDRDETLQEIVIHGNSTSVGQVAVDGAMIKARKITFKYTFVPGEWNHLVFPSDINLDQASDLAAKGYILNNADPCAGGYFVQAYDTRAAAQTPDRTAWKPVGDPVLKGRTGYVIMLSEGRGKEPVEVTFTFDNEVLDLDRESLPMLLSLDLSQMRPYTTQDIYVKAQGVASNTLKVKVDFQPSNPDALPVNHTAALEDMRVTFTSDLTGMRLTLPDQTEARVAIFDRRGKRLLKAVRYVSPFVIDISDLKPGTYRMAVRYGAATATRTVEIPKR